MKKYNLYKPILSFSILTAFFSLISLIASPTSIRYSWQSLNPWNSVLGITDLLKRFISADLWIIYLLTVVLILLLWWRIHALINQLRKR